jgi:heme/copper-type cytochrome/quinol oxidase subunit 3
MEFQYAFSKAAYRDDETDFVEIWNVYWNFLDTVWINDMHGR